MSKPKKSVGEWLSGLLGASHKAVSENLTAEQYSQLVIDAGKFRASQEAKEDDDEANETDDEEDQDEESETPDPKNADSKNSSFEARLSALENGLVTAKNALKSEQKAHKATTTKLTETEGKLKLAEAQKGKLRQAVNPLGDEDITNQESQDTGLTKVDIEARESWKKNRSEA